MMYLLFNGKRRDLAHCLLRYRSFWARKHSKQLAKYPHVLYLNQRKLCIYAYYDIRNLIEIRSRGVKTIALPLDH